MQPTLVGKLIGMFVDRIISEVLAGETGAACLQQVGLFTLQVCRLISGIESSVAHPSNCWILC